MTSACKCEPLFLLFQIPDGEVRSDESRDLDPYHPRKIGTGFHMAPTVIMAVIDGQPGVSFSFLERAKIVGGICNKGDLSCSGNTTSKLCHLQLPSILKQ